MLISDWSSVVCSSDLGKVARLGGTAHRLERLARILFGLVEQLHAEVAAMPGDPLARGAHLLAGFAYLVGDPARVGRARLAGAGLLRLCHLYLLSARKRELVSASCRERVCQ